MRTRIRVARPQRVKSSSPSTLSSSISNELTSLVQVASNDDATLDRSCVEEKDSDQFPDKYIIPSLPNSLIKDIEDGHLKKFSPHFSNRQISVDIIAHDLINKHKLLYVFQISFLLSIIT
jgi:hypothetical protein